MSSVVQFASQGSNGNEEVNERHDSLQISDPMVTILSLPVETFVRAAVSLKDQVVQVTWKGQGKNGTDATAYSGLLGTAFTCLRAYEATGSREDLLLCAAIVDACASVDCTYTRESLSSTVRIKPGCPGTAGI